MYPTLQLLTLPSTRPRIVRIHRQRRAWLAADAGVTGPSFPYSCEHLLECFAHRFRCLFVRRRPPREMGQTLRKTERRHVRDRATGLAHRIGDHAGAAGEMRAGIDQDEAAGAAVVGVAVER